MLPYKFKCLLKIETLSQYFKADWIEYDTEKHSIDRKFGVK